MSCGTSGSVESRDVTVPHGPREGVLKIVHHVNTLAAAGTEKAAVLLARWAQRRGHTVTLLTYEGGLRHNWASELLDVENVRLLDVKADRAAALLDALALLDPQIVHLHRGCIERPTPTEIRERCPNAKVVVHSIFGDVYQDADLNVFVSPELAASRAKACEAIPLSKLAVIRNPVRPPHETMIHGRLEGLPEGALVCGSLGRPDPSIFDSTAIEALATYATAAKSRPVLYVRMGASEPEARLIRDFGLPHRFLPPTCSDSEITRFFNSLDLYLHSRRDGESDGMALAEAMAHGVRVVTHAQGVFQAHVERCSRYFPHTRVVPAGDVLAYAQAISDMDGDELGKRLARGVLPARIMEEAGIDKVGELMLGCYERLVA